MQTFTEYKSCLSCFNRLFSLYSKFIEVGYSWFARAVCKLSEWLQNRLGATALPTRGATLAGSQHSFAGVTMQPQFCRTHSESALKTQTLGSIGAPDLRRPEIFPQGVDAFVAGVRRDHEVTHAGETGFRYQPGAQRMPREFGGVEADPCDSLLHDSRHGLRIDGAKISDRSEERAFRVAAVEQPGSQARGQVGIRVFAADNPHGASTAFLVGLALPYLKPHSPFGKGHVAQQQLGDVRATERTGEAEDDDSPVPDRFGGTFRAQQSADLPDLVKAQWLHFAGGLPQEPAGAGEQRPGIVGGRRRIAAFPVAVHDSRRTPDGCRDLASLTKQVGDEERECFGAGWQTRSFDSSAESTEALPVVFVALPSVRSVQAALQGAPLDIQGIQIVTQVGEAQLSHAESMAKGGRDCKLAPGYIIRLSARLPQNFRTLTRRIAWARGRPPPEALISQLRTLLGRTERNSETQLHPERVFRFGNLTTPQVYGPSAIPFNRNRGTK